MKIKTRPDAVAQLMTGLAAGLPKATALFAEALAVDTKKRTEVLIAINNVEQQADDRHAAFLTKVEDTFITPFDREDLLSIAELLDDVIDALDHTVDLLVRFELDELPKNFINCADDLNEMAELVVEAVELIKKPKKFRKLWDDITAIENRLDTRHNEIVADLLSGDYEVFHALKLKAVADTIENTANMMDDFVRSIARTAIKET
jgi:predicted phosphate transport protein (TIGR00153 family)